MQRGQPLRDRRLRMALRQVGEVRPQGRPAGIEGARQRPVAAGPLMLQADHGPVAFRNMRVRVLESAKK
jgi:hypothetical protein